MNAEGIVKVVQSCVGHFPSVDFTKIHFQNDEIQNLCLNASNAFKNQKIVLKLKQPLIIIGDIHGNAYDLIRIFSIFGMPPHTSYLFLGDYVDRGEYSTIVITFLLALMLKYPNNIFIIRGNHEFEVINRIYGFYDEIMRIYNSESIYNSFQLVFSYIPLAAVIDNSVFCVHGGLSPSLNEIKEIEGLHRPIMNYSDNNIISDILWSDPSDLTIFFKENRRGLGVMYSAEAVKSFLQKNSFKLLIRAHQCVRNGVNIFADYSGLTVFTSSRYNENKDNRSGVIKIDNSNNVELISLSIEPSLTEKETATLYLYKEVIGLHVENEKLISPEKAKTPTKMPRRRSRSESPKKELPKKTIKTKRRPRFTSDAKNLKPPQELIKKSNDSAPKKSSETIVHKKIVMKRKNSPNLKKKEAKKSLFEIELTKCKSENNISSMCGNKN